MNKQTFEKHITRLEKAIKPIAGKEKERDDKVAVYYERLKDADEYLFGKAVELLQETYGYKSFPLISEIFAAIGMARDSLIVQHEPGSECSYCQGTGWVVRDCIDRLGMENNIASPCKNCSAGRAVKKACAIKDERMGKKIISRRRETIVKEAVESLPDADLF